MQSESLSETFNPVWKEELEYNSNSYILFVWLLLMCTFKCPFQLWKLTNELQEKNLIGLVFFLKHIRNSLQGPNIDQCACEQLAWRFQCQSFTPSARSFKPEQDRHEIHAESPVPKEWLPKILLTYRPLDCPDQCFSLWEMIKECDVPPDLL